MRAHTHTHTHIMYPLRENHCQINDMVVKSTQTCSIHIKVKVAQLCPTLCDPMGLYSPLDSPGQNTGVGSLSLLQEMVPTQGLIPGLPQCRWILYQLRYQGTPRILEWIAHPSPGDLPNPGIEPGSPALQADSLPAELPGNEHKILSYEACDSETRHLALCVSTPMDTEFTLQWPCGIYRGVS